MTRSSSSNVHAVSHNITHVPQQYNWDCGVSCVMMLLTDDQRQRFTDNFTQICTEEGFQQSTWTIDLCYLLKRFGIEHCMYTTAAGVKDEYKNLNYYNSIIEADRGRITERFLKASSNGIQVYEREPTMELIVSHLSERGPVVMLVNSNLLVCDICKHNKLKAEFRKCFGASYSGHYIVLVGVSGRRILYLDPARAGKCATTFTALKQAASSHGTDDDCILIYNQYR